MSDTLKAEVRNITFHNPSNGWTVARVHADNGLGSVTVVGVMPEINPGEMVELSGCWKEHPKFGRQFEVHVCQQMMPATENGIRRYLASGLIKGVGKVMAKRLVEAFGTEVLDILDSEPEKLLAVEGVGRKTLSKIKESWDAQHEVRNLMLFLQSHDVSPTHAARIYQRYGNSAVKKLKDNPYELAYEIRGVAFRTADNMALKLGFATDAPQRIEAAVIYALSSASSDKGHLFLPFEKLVPAVLGLLEGGQTGCGGAAPTEFDIPLDEEGWPCDEYVAIGPVQVEAAVGDLSVRKKVMVEDLSAQGIERAVYLMQHYRQETEIASRLYHLIEHPTPLDIKKIRTVMPRLEASDKIELSGEQREAVLGGCENKIFVITGGPGTGKTTITRIMVQCLDEMKFRIKLAAPTGRAAKRMAEATGFPASTLHRLLQYSPDGGFAKSEDDKLKADAVVVDEASMLDVSLFLALLRALPLTCRLILIGDVNQLPSVGPGNILSDVIDSQAVPSAVLTRIYRQARESLIVTNAHRINNGQLPENPEPPGPEHDFFWVRRQEAADIQRYILELVTERIPTAYGLDPKRDIQVLTPIHKGELGTQALNALLQERINPSGREIKRGNTIYRVGDRVLQLKNDYDKDVFNGDLGWIEDVDPNDGEVLVNFDGRMVMYESFELDELAPAYAISVHKSQGSEYPAVVMPVVTQHYVMLERNLIYTGLTRAKRLAVMIGQTRAMNIGLGRKESRKRFTHLRYRLQEAVNR
ncbi:AAA family ATPase [Desulfovibrio ferrophilus]|uniref:Helicase, RecD/TraA family n=1 Tax=Desulfovibrio ferrophilus TaxID=241368 RepID=A0A2Z6AXC5_9BACT|nr:AAA family ATPase [Desulfovibrio ferrophilus]BBD07891.1 helicase, RecD/TraA family [Desulfovibrio ferrophilus]